MLPYFWNFSHIENTAPVVHRKFIHNVVHGVMVLHMLQLERLMVQRLKLLYSLHSDPWQHRAVSHRVKGCGHWQLEVLPSSVLLVQPVPQLAARLFVELGHNPPVFSLELTLAQPCSTEQRPLVPLCLSCSWDGTVPRHGAVVQTSPGFPCGRSGHWLLAEPEGIASH